jgi:hypothetical protein
MTAPNLPAVDLTGSIENIWGIALQPMGCSVCRQAHLAPASWLGKACPACGRGRLESQPALLRRETPEMMLPFRVDRTHLAAALASFTKGVWLAPDDFTPASLLNRAVPVFWPVWLVDCDAAGDWQAEAGFNYQVKSSQERYGSAGWQTNEVIETRIRWEPRLGQLKRHYDNLAAPAASDHQRLMVMVGGYQGSQAIPYQADLIGSAALRVPDLQPEAAWPLAESAIQKAAAGEVQQACASAHLRNFTLHAGYSGLNWTQRLLPAFATYYTADDGVPQVVLINGQSGQVGGLRLASQRKGWRLAGLLAGIGALLFLLGLALMALGALLPPIAVLGLVLVIGGIGLALGAIIPAAWPWQWNRQQR